MNYFGEVEQQLAKRKGESLAAQRVPGEGAVQFLLSPSDGGVIRNGGRSGARFAPQAILHCLSKMPFHCSHPWEAHDVVDGEGEKANFNASQLKSSEIIAKLLPFRRSRAQLGGGHDHIYPLLKALEKFGQRKLVVVNIDAHCDTRPDTLAHSGTPFRQFDQETARDFELIQLGIHPYANTLATLAPLRRGQMTVHRPQDLPESRLRMVKYLQDTIQVDPNAHYVLSLDCDALCASIMEGVSAVNHQGLTAPQVQGIFQWAKALLPPTRITYGIYEYNPVYDNLSQKGARFLAALLYNAFFTSRDYA